MCSTAKDSIMAWWLLAILFFFLWYRDRKYDRVISLFVLMLGLIQLIEYGAHSGASPYQSGKAIFLTLWLQCLVLAIGVYIYIGSHRNKSFISNTEDWIYLFSGFNLVFFSLVFIIALVLSFTGDYLFYAAPVASGHIEWKTNGSSLLGWWGWLYLVGITIPFLLLLAFYSWKDIGIIIFLLYGILSFIYVVMSYPQNLFGSMWCYLSLGLAFLAWFVGLFQE